MKYFQDPACSQITMFEYKQPIVRTIIISTTFLPSLLWGLALHLARKIVQVFVFFVLIVIIFKSSLPAPATGHN
jgi:hypothetical protein